MTATCLTIIFNHPFPANIPKLRELYADRFTFVRFIQPLLRSDDDDVWTVYRGSYSHGAYVTDCLERLLELDAERYIFLQDDVLLSPALTEANLDQVFELSQDVAFIGNLMHSGTEDIGEWGFWPGTIWRLLNPRNLLSGTGVESWDEIKKLLPSSRDASEKLRALGVTPKRFVRTSASLSFPMVTAPLFAGCDAPKTRDFYENTLRNLAPDGALTLDYPLVSAGPSADFYILPRGSITSFAHICGTLCAAGAFVEVAIGTAMVLSANNVRRAADLGLSLVWSSTPLTVDDALTQMADDHSVVAAHPIKLSREQGSLKDRAEAHPWEQPVGRFGSLLERAKRLAPDFDPDSYLEANPDVLAAGADPVAHFILHGHKENRALRR